MTFPYRSNQDSNSTDDFADWGDRIVRYITPHIERVSGLKKRASKDAGLPTKRESGLGRLRRRV
jgi:hypothetical protein